MGISEEPILPLSVAICTRNRTEKLAHALNSLKRQSHSPYEILVIDNAPDDEQTKELVLKKHPKARYIHEPILGLNFARNRALREATQDIIAYLDDDAVASENWSYTLWKVFDENQKVGICTGNTFPKFQETEAEKLFEKNGGFGRGEIKIRLPQDATKALRGLRVPLITWAVSVGNGTNFALRRSFALKLGDFDEAFELGEALHGGGDLDMFWRMLDQGYELIYEPDARVQHEHRKELDAMTTQLASHQRALIAFLQKSMNQASGRKRWSIALFFAWRLLKPGVRILRRCIGLDPLPLGVLWKIWAQTLSGVNCYHAACQIAQKRREQQREMTP